MLKLYGIKLKHTEILRKKIESKTKLCKYKSLLRMKLHL